MMDLIFQNHCQWGWQCPVCKNVYAPSVTLCFNCPSNSKIKFDTKKKIENEAKIKQNGKKYVVK
jgi:uncharacterized OB-fold protein